MGSKLLVFTDGASRGNPGKAAIAFLICSEESILERGAKFIGLATNNEAEYKAAIEALGQVRSKYSNSDVVFHSDSKLLISQMKGEWKVKEKRLQELHVKAKSLASGLSSIKYRHVRRTHPMIKKADMMANHALDRLR